MPCQAASVSAAGRALCKLASLCIPEFIKEHTAASSLSQLKDQINLCLVSQGPSWRAVICAGRSRAVGGLWVHTHTVCTPRAACLEGVEVVGTPGQGWGGTTRLCSSITATGASGREFSMEKWDGVLLEWGVRGQASPYNLCCLKELLSAGSSLWVFRVSPPCSRSLQVDLVHFLSTYNTAVLAAPLGSTF